jgi:hypothetical protein
MLASFILASIEVQGRARAALWIPAERNFSAKNEGAGTIAWIGKSRPRRGNPEDRIVSAVSAGIGLRSSGRADPPAGESGRGSNGAVSWRPGFDSSPSSHGQSWHRRPPQWSRYQSHTPHGGIARPGRRRQLLPPEKPPCRGAGRRSAFPAGSTVLPAARRGSVRDEPGGGVATWDCDTVVHAGLPSHFLCYQLRQIENHLSPRLGKRGAGRNLFSSLWEEAASIISAVPQDLSRRSVHSFRRPPSSRIRLGLAPSTNRKRNVEQQRGSQGNASRRNRLHGLGVALLAASLALPTASAQAQERRQYGSNFGWMYSTPRTTYYNGPTIGLIAPYAAYPFYGYGYGGGGNVQYFRSGRSGFAVETYRDRNGRLRQRTGVFYYGGRYGGR